MQVQRSALLHYSARQMYRLVADVDRYAEFLSWCSASRILSREPVAGGEEVVASLSIDYKGIQRPLVTRNTNIPDREIRMQLVEGPFSELRGCWRFTALAEQASKIELDLSFEFSSAVTRRLMKPVLGRMTDGQVDAFQYRARDVYG